jgi:GNAT superfamily N-acetyltransferase
MTHRTDFNFMAGLEMHKKFSIETIEERDIDFIIEMCEKLFSEALGYDYPGIFIYEMTDFAISKKAVLDGKIIGCYLLNDQSVHSYPMNWLENLDLYQTRCGLQGVALGILKEYRGYGYGRQLRDSTLCLNEYDYIWGGQAKQLNNLDNWLGYGRRLVGETVCDFITLMDLGEEARITA